MSTFSPSLYFKAAISEAFGAPVERLCLIYADKVLKDHETLNTHGIKDAKTVQLVIKMEEEEEEYDGDFLADARAGLEKIKRARKAAKTNAGAGPSTSRYL